MSDQTRDRIVPLAPFGAPHVFLLAVIQGSNPNAVHRLVSPETVVGRGDEADFQVSDDEVSKRHLVLYVSGSVVSLVDLHSKNGTRVNAKTLEAGVRERLRHLDEVQVGNTRMVFIDARFRGDSGS